VAERLDRSALMDQARAATGLDDFGDGDFIEPLDVLVASLESDAGLDARSRGAAEGTLIGLLVKRLRLVEDRRSHPAIAEEKITAPVFIVGLPRTGSTHLHALLGQVEGVRTPLFWEMTLPSPPPEAATAATDPRIAEVQAMVDRLPPELLVRHPIAPTRPEQCNMLNDWSFLHQALMASYEIPSYWNYLLDADYRPAFEAHRRMLQHLQWHNPGRWVLKYPKHLMALDVLIEAYPDAGLVWTHRDPGVVVPSVVSFTGYMRASGGTRFDQVRFGREWAALEEMVLRRGMAVRAELPDAGERIIDVSYQSIMQDPVGTVAAIAQRFAIPFTAASKDRVQAFVDAHPKSEHGQHRYRPEDFGLDADRLRRRFGFYIRHFGVESEA
jgi:Sulfotransferase family